jgi:glycosyltransferase involved in cell wall biosynthesis
MSFCDLFVLPSYQEGLPCVVLEAMACAKPVISTPIMGIPEAVVEGETGLLVQPGHPNDLQDAMQTLLSNPDLCKSLGQRGKKRVTEKFTWNQHAQQMTSIFENLISI